MLTPRLDPRGSAPFARDLADTLTVAAGSVGILGVGLAVLWAAAPAVGASVPVEIALAQAHRIAEHIESFRSSEGRLPDSLHEVYTEHVPRDPWGHPWHLQRDTASFSVVSYGADGRPGGTGDAADVRLSDLEASLGTTAWVDA